MPSRQLARRSLEDIVFPLLPDSVSSSLFDPTAYNSDHENHGRVHVVHQRQSVCVGSL